MFRRLLLIVSCLLLLVVLVGEPDLPERELTRAQRFGRYTRVGLDSLDSFSFELVLGGWWTMWGVVVLIALFVAAFLVIAVCVAVDAARFGPTVF